MLILNLRGGKQAVEEKISATSNYKHETGSLEIVGSFDFYFKRTKVIL